MNLVWTLVVSGMELSNNYIKNVFATVEKKKTANIIEKLRQIADIEDEVLLKLYNASISIRQRNVQQNGSTLENEIEKFLVSHHISYKPQVVIDKTGTIISESKEDCHHIVDFAIGDVVVGSNISNYIVLSCKKSCRERWTQDNWTLKQPPKLYVLLTISNDYPQSRRFQENENE